jgi:hypothetical protein
MATAYSITGTVIDRKTRQGVTGLRVEAWDRDTRYHDMLGQQMSRSDGGFTFEFDSEYFGDFAPDRLPDVFFRVFLGKQLLLSTQQASLENLRTTATHVVLEVDMPEAAPAGVDRLSTARAVSGVEFVRQSDFRGVGRETVARFGMVGRVLGRFVVDALAEMELQPLRSPAVQTRDVVGQDVFTAQKNLSAQQVTVSEVREYKAGDPAVALSSVTAVPGRVRPGESVVLHQQDGQVKYYSVVRQETPASIEAEDVARLDGEVKTLRADVNQAVAVRDNVSRLKTESDQSRMEVSAELAAMRAQVAELEKVRTELQVVRQQSAEKDREITTLQRDLATLTESQSRLTSRLTPERLEKLEALDRIEIEGPVRPLGSKKKTPRKPPSR